MINEIEKYELIEKYLLNITSKEEKELVENLINNDPAFKEEVELHKEIQNIIIDYKLIELKTKLQKIHDKNIRSKNFKGKNILPFITGIIIIFSILYFTFRRNNMTSLPDPEASNASGSLIVGDTNHEITINTSKAEKIKNISKDNLMNSNKLNNQDSKNHPSNTDSVSSENKIQNTKIIREQEKKLQNEEYDTIIKTTKKEEVTLKLQEKICKLEASYLTEPSCNTHSSGKIELIEESIKEGTPPYTLYINEKEYKSKAENLSPGSYKVKLIDKNNCISIKEIKINTKDCFNEFIFSPSHNELWDIPIKENKTGLIKIFDKNGKLVFMKEILTNNELWDGNDINNIPLPSGLYPFIIYYNDGEIFRGSVTIIR